MADEPGHRQTEMKQAVFEFVAAPADEAFGGLKCQRVIRFDQVAGFAGQLAGHAHLAGQNGALGLLAAGAEAALDKGLVQPGARHGAAPRQADLWYTRRCTSRKVLRNMSFSATVFCTKSESMGSSA